jgi:hypothetical protein
MQDRSQCSPLTNSRRAQRRSSTKHAALCRCAGRWPTSGCEATAAQPQCPHLGMDGWGDRWMDHLCLLQLAALLLLSECAATAAPPPCSAHCSMCCGDMPLQQGCPCHCGQWTRASASTSAGCAPELGGGTPEALFARAAPHLQAGWRMRRPTANVRSAERGHAHTRRAIAGRGIVQQRERERTSRTSRTLAHACLPGWMDGGWMDGWMDDMTALRVPAATLQKKIRLPEQ